MTRQLANHTSLLINVFIHSFIHSFIVFVWFIYLYVLFVCLLQCKETGEHGTCGVSVPLNVDLGNESACADVRILPLNTTVTTAWVRTDKQCRAVSPTVQVRNTSFSFEFRGVSENQEFQDVKVREYIEPQGATLAPHEILTIYTTCAIHKAY